MMIKRTLIVATAALGIFAGGAQGVELTPLMVECELRLRHSLEQVGGKYYTESIHNDETLEHPMTPIMRACERRISRLVKEWGGEISTNGGNLGELSTLLPRPYPSETPRRKLSRLPEVRLPTWPLKDDS
jgi:hypothetical protein